MSAEQRSFNVRGVRMVIAWLSLGAMVVGFVNVGIQDLRTREHSAGGAIGVVLIVAVFVLLLMWLIVRLWFAGVFVDGDRLMVRSEFRTKSFDRAEIVGAKLGMAANVGRVRATLNLALEDGSTEQCTLLGKYLRPKYAQVVVDAVDTWASSRPDVNS